MISKQQQKMWNEIPSTSIGILNDIEEAIQTKDFNRFAKYVVVQPNVKTKINLSYDNLYPEQQQFCLNRTGKDIVVKPRKVGFSTLECARDLFFCLSNDQSEVHLMAQNARVSKDLLTVCRDMFVQLSEFVDRILIESDLSLNLNPFALGTVAQSKSRRARIKKQDSQTIIRFNNGSTLRSHTAGSTPGNAGKSIRGGTANRIHLTEMAHWTYQNIAWQSVSPMIYDDVEIVIESTPLKMEDDFQQLYNEAKIGLNGYKAHFYPWMNHPKYSLKVPIDLEVVPQNNRENEMVINWGITKQQLYFFQDRVRSLRSFEAALAEYPCDDQSCFMAAALREAGQRFVDDEVENYLNTMAVDPIDKVQLNGPVSMYQYKFPENDETEYVIGVDAASGRGADCTAFVVLDVRDSSVCAFGYSQFVLQQNWGPIIDEVRNLYCDSKGNPAWFVTEAQSSLVLLHAVKELNEQNMAKDVWGYVHKTNEGAWWSSEQSRMALFDNFSQWLKERRTGRLPKRIVKETLSLHWNEKTSKWEALGKTKKGKKKPTSPMDDCALAYCLALFIAKERRKELDIKVKAKSAPIWVSKPSNNSVGPSIQTMKSNSTEALTDALRSKGGGNPWRIRGRKTLW